MVHDKSASDIVEQLFLEDGNKRFQEFVKKLVSDISRGEIAPNEAYNLLFQKVEEFFPQYMKDSALRESLIQRVQLYMQMCILSPSKGKI